ncbi:MAG: endolytic transglycosylase MltG [Coriobacteriia bacterium]
MSGRHGMRRASRRTLTGVAAGLAVAFVVLFAVAVVWWSIFVRAAVPVDEGRSVEVVVPHGASSERIAQILAGEGIVRNANMLRLQARRRGVDGELKAGTYDMVTGMGYTAAIDALVAGPPAVFYRVLIPEGFTIEQMAQRFGKVAGIDVEEFRRIARSGAGRFDFPFLADDHTGSLEGYLFPKTYRVKQGTTAEQVIRMMLVQFGTETSGIDLSYLTGSGLDRHEWVTLASMVEREAKIARDRPLIASVIYNRLRTHMKLQIDATLEYVLPGTKPRLSLEDLKVESPYNTYTHEGLPPGPISSPGLASLKAAAKPAETGYLYYVLTSRSGAHTFTTNVADFLKAKRASRKVVP